MITRRFWLTLLPLLAIVAVALVALHAGSGRAQPPPGFMPVPPAIDGTQSPGEWSTASSVGFTVGGRSGTLYAGNNETDLFLAVVVADPSYSGDADSLVVFFDNDAGGGTGRAVGDDGLQQTGDPYGRWFDDTFYQGAPSESLDTIDDGNEDGAGAGLYSGGQWMFELSHPLCSDDSAHDFCLSPGDAVGFALRVFDNGSQVGDYPGDVFVPSQYGQIAIQGVPAQIVTVGVDKVITEFNQHDTRFEDDPNNPPPWPDVREAYSEGNAAGVSLLAISGEAGVAKARVGVYFDWDLGSYTWEEVQDWPVSVTFDFSHVIEANWDDGYGSANAAVGRAGGGTSGGGTPTPAGPWYDRIGFETGEHGTREGSAVETFTTAVDGSPLTVGKLEELSRILAMGVYCQVHTTPEGYTSSSSADVQLNSITIDFLQPDLTGLALTVDEEEIGAGAAAVPIADIPVSAMRLLSSVVAGAPLSSIDIENSPLSSIPLSSIPLSSIDVGGTLLSSIPLSSIGLSSIGGWEAILAGTELQGVPLQFLTLEDVLALDPLPPGLAAITLADLDLSSTPLSSIGLAGLALGSLPLSSIALSSIGLDWCTVLADLGFPCPDLGATTVLALGIQGVPLSSIPLSSIPLSSIPIAGTPLSSIPLSSIPLSSIPLSSIPLSSIPLSSIGIAGTPLSSIPLSSIALPDGFADWCAFLATFGTGFECSGSYGLSPSSQLYDLVQAILTAGGSLDSSPLSSIPLSSIPLSSIPLSSITLSSIPLSSIAIGGTPLSSIPLSSIPLSSISSIVDCSLVDCANDTLGDAADAGAILAGATVQDMMDALGASLNDMTIILSFFYGDILLGDPEADLGDVTLGDILLALLLGSNLPWEQLPLDEMEVQRFAGTDETLHYHLSFANSGSNPAVGTVASVELPEGFLYVPNSTSLAICPIGYPCYPVVFDEPVAEGSLLTWSLETIAAGYQVELDFNALAGLRLGIFSSSATVSAGAVSTSVDNQAPVQVVENFEPNDDPASADPILEPGVLYISHISSGTDVDFFRIPVPAESGSRVSVSMSHLGNDNDLVMYKPAAAPLSSIPLIPVQDDGLGAGNIGDALPPETLQDIALQSLPLSSISANRGTSAEGVRAISQGEAGFYTIQVSGFNGSSSPDPYVLRVKVTPPPPTPQCEARAFPFDGEGIAGAIPAISAAVNTLFIVNQERLGDTYGATAANGVMTALGALAGRADLGMSGAVIPVEGYSEVAQAYAAWDEDNPCSPLLANDVVMAIASRINEMRAAHPGVQFIVVVGSDEIVPMARVPDLTQLSNESDYAADLAFTGGNALRASVLTGHILTDDAYGDGNPIPWLDRELYVPEIAVGRLVETPEEIVAALENFQDAGGALDPQSALTTGYDFLADGAQAVDSSLGAHVGAANAQELINDIWTLTDLISAFLDATPPDIASINAHYDHFRALPAIGNTTGDESDLFTTQQVDALSPGLPGRIIFSMGCHSGLNVADVLVSTAGPRVLDWPQVYAQQGALYAANTGYGYGDTAAIALSERLMALFAERLDGSMTVGQALTFAKQEYFAGLGVYGVYDEKALVEATFYGLPMYQVGPAVAPPPPPAPLPLTEEPIAGLQAATIHIEPAFDPVVTPRGKFYRVDGKAQVTHYRPIEPRTEFDVTQPDAIAHDAIITDVVSMDETPFDPVLSRPVIDLGANEPEPIFGDVVFPTALQNVSTFVTPAGPRQRLVLIPGRYFSTEDGSGVQRLFTSIDAQVYYSGSADFVPPTLRRTEAVIIGPVVGFVVNATDNSPATVKRVLVLFREVSAEPSSDWRSVELVQTPGTNRWTGGALVSSSEIEYFVQAVDSAGNVGVASNKGRLHQALSLPSLPPEVSVTGVEGDNGWFLGDATITITGTEGVLFGISVDGQPFEGYIGPFAVGGDGIHTVEFRGSDGSRGNMVVPIDTTLSTITIDTPPQDAVYTLGQTVASSYSCADAGSGIVSCDGPAPSGSNVDTSTAGSKVFRVTATDAAGNASSLEHAYTVINPDSDGDSVGDDDDNCPGTSNPAQTDSDGDGLGDACDPDDDNDSLGQADVFGRLHFRDVIEAFVGTDRLDACADNRRDAAWPPDFDNDRRVGVKDVAALAIRLGSRAGGPRYSRRYDLDADGRIDIWDGLILLKYLGKTCS
jgi:uncharacterized repeat protein (TIGR01451 family)